MNERNRVYTAGTFDTPHPGHVSFLNKCALLGNVTVAVNTDEFVERYKGKRPLYAYKERAAVIGALKSVTLVVPQDSGCLGPQLSKIRPDYLVVGSDWATRDYYAQIGVDQTWLDLAGITLVYVPYTSGISSTVLKQRLAA